MNQWLEQIKRRRIIRRKKFVPYLQIFSGAELFESISRFPNWHDAHRLANAELRYRGLTCIGAAAPNERDRAQLSKNEKNRLAELQRQRKVEERRPAEARRERQAEEARSAEA